MIWIIIALWLFLIIGIIILIKKHIIILKEAEVKLNKKIQRKVAELEEKYQREKVELEGKYLIEKTELETDFNLKKIIMEKDFSERESFLTANLTKEEQKLTQIKNETKLVEQHCDELRKFGEQQVNEKIKLYKEFKYKELETQFAAEQKKQDETLQKHLDQFVSFAAETKLSLNQEIEELRLILEDYKLKRELINKAIVHEKEIREQQDFYRIVLNESDKEDIQILNTIEMRLHSREALYKLIYDVFY